MHSCLANTDKDVNLLFRSSTFGSGSHTTSSQNAFNLLFKGKERYRSSSYYLNFNDAHNLMSYRTLEGAYITYLPGRCLESLLRHRRDTAYQSRHVLMLHPEGIVLIYDELEASEPVTKDWLLHSPLQLSLNKELLTINHAEYKSGYTAVTHLFCNNPVSMSLTDQFLVAPDPTTMKAGETYPNQWHMTARIKEEAQTRILAIIQVNASNVSTQFIRKTSNTLTVGKWTIDAELNVL